MLSITCSDALCVSGPRHSPSQTQHLPQLLTPEQLRQQLSGSGTPPAVTASSSSSSRPASSPSPPQARASPSSPASQGRAAGAGAGAAGGSGRAPSKAQQGVGSLRPGTSGSNSTQATSGPGPPVHTALTAAASTTSRLPPRSPHRAASGHGALQQPKVPSSPTAAAKGYHQGESQGSSATCGRFQTLLRLQGTLLTGLHEHAASDGTAGAHGALVASVNQMQSHFSACIQEAQNLLGIRGAAPGEEQQQQGGATGSTSTNPGVHQERVTAHAANFRSDAPQLDLLLPMLQAHMRGQPAQNVPLHLACYAHVLCVRCWSLCRRQRWERLLQLGQLGLTGADIARLQQLRRQQAARCIQRQV